MDILLVDDSKTMRMLVQRAIRQAGYRSLAIGEAENGVQALESMQKEKPKLVLSDWNMPEMSGIQLLQSLRESWEHCAASGSHAFGHRVTMRLASTYAIREVRQVAQDAYDDAGATAIFESHPFERRMRDMLAVTQQIQANPLHLQTAGQHYLGMKAGTRFI